jgi:hypothetical protein
MDIPKLAKRWQNWAPGKVNVQIGKRKVGSRITDSNVTEICKCSNFLGESGFPNIFGDFDGHHSRRLGAVSPVAKPTGNI